MLIETDRYIKMALQEHLYNRENYRLVSPAAVEYTKQKIKSLLQGFILKHGEHISGNDKKYMTNVIKTNKDPLPILYLLMKVHKEKLSSRPVIP